MADCSEAQESVTERREYFRVKDVLPITVKKIENMLGKKSRVLSGYLSGLQTVNTAEDLSDGMVNPKLVKMLCEMNAKLDLILEKVFGSSEEPGTVEPQEVSLSASGISFHSRDEFHLGDLVEVMMKLPLHPPAWIVLYGNVSRAQTLEDEGYEVAVHFAEMEDEARNLLSYYTIKRQREIIMKQRRMEM